MTGMDDLVTFLRAQLDDDERVVLQLNAAPGGVYLEPETPDVNTMNLGAYLMRWPPKRMLAEVDAKRRILDLHGPVPTGPTWQPGPPQCEYCASLCHSRSGLGCDTPDAPYPCDNVRLLALPYADRPGYREEWRP